jgi:hypothetical protein
MSPDLNPPLESTQPTSPIQLVLGKFDPAHTPEEGIRAVELEGGSWFRLAPPKRHRARKRLAQLGVQVIPRMVLRTIRDPESFPEILQTLHEEFVEGLRGVILASGRKIWDTGQDEAWEAVLRGLPQGVQEKLMLEWGESDTPRTTRSGLWALPHFGAVLDPDLHRRSMGRTGREEWYRLHGWHPERWVRRYGGRQVEDCVRRILRRSSSSRQGVLILGHSGRLEESGVFLRAIASAQS